MLGEALVCFCLQVARKQILQMLAAVGRRDSGEGTRLLLPELEKAAQRVGGREPRSPDFLPRVDGPGCPALGEGQADMGDISEAKETPVDCARLLQLASPWSLVTASCFSLVAMAAQCKPVPPLALARLGDASKLTAGCGDAAGAALPPLQMCTSLGGGRSPPGPWSQALTPPVSPAPAAVLPAMPAAGSVVCLT